MSYLSVFANPLGRTSRGQFIGGLIVLLLVAAFYYFVVKAGLNGQWVLFTLLYPAFVLHARRLHDMGKTAWLAVLPGALLGVAIWPPIEKHGAYQTPLLLAAVAVCAALAIWCLVDKGQAEANKFGEPAAA